MIDVTLLADPARCPDCGEHFAGPRPHACAACDLPLDGPLALDLWDVSVAAKELLDRRALLLGRLRASVAEVAAPRVAAEQVRPGEGRPARGPFASLSQPAAPAWPGAPRTAPDHDAAPVSGRSTVAPADPYSAGVPVDAGSAPLRPSAPPAMPFFSGPDAAPAGPAAPRAPEVGGRRVARFFLGTGVLLLIVAAIVFVAVTWERAGTGGRAVVMAAMLVVSALGTALAERRHLPLTAEALGAVTVAMGLLDGYAAWAADVGGLRGADGLLVTAGTLTAVGAAAWAGSRVLGLRTLRLSAALLLQAPVPLVAGQIGVARESLLPLAVGFAAQAAAEVALLRGTFRAFAAREAAAKADGAAAGVSGLPGSPAVRVALFGAAAYWAAAFVLAAAETGSGAGTMVFVAFAAGLTAWLMSAFAPLRHGASAACTVALYSALLMLAPLVGDDSSPDSRLPAAWGPAFLAAFTLVTVALVGVVPRAYRPGPLAILAVPFAVGFVAAVTAVFAAGVAPVAWSAEPWTASGGPLSGARALMTPDRPWGLGASPLLGVPAVGVTAVVAARLLGRAAWVRRLVVATGAALVLVLPMSLNAPMVLGAACQLVAGVALFATAERVARGGADRVIATRLGGVALIAVAAVWSLAYAELSVAAWAVVAVVLVALAVRTPAWRPGLLAAATGLVFADLGLAARWRDIDAALAGMGVAVLAAAVVVAAVLSLRKVADSVSAWAVLGTAALAGVVGTMAAGARTWTVAVALGAAAAAALAGALAEPPARRPWWAVVCVAAAVPAAGLAAYAGGVGAEWSAVLGAAFAGAVLAAAPRAVGRRVSLVKSAAEARLVLSAGVEGAAALAYTPAALLSARDAWALAAALAVGVVAAGSRVPSGRSAAGRLWPPVGAGLLLGAVTAAAHAAGRPPESVALVVVCLAGALLVLVALVPGNVARSRRHVAAVLAFGGAAGVATLAGERPERVWIALAVGGGAAVLTGALPGAARFRRTVSGAGVVLLFAAYWAGLGTAGVEAVEAYTLPPGVALLAGGWWQRREAECAPRSWPAFGPGLVLVLLPSLPLAVSGDEPVRPALLGAAALACLVAGARFRLQAPLVLGAGTLAVVGVFQLSDPVLAAYDALPRWAVLAGAGVVLIVLGAGYERRLRDLARLGRAVRGLD